MGMTTASRQSQAIGDLYRDWLRIPGETPGWTAEDDYHQNEGWQVLTAEPGGVDYLEVDAGGRPALWAVPHGTDGSAVLFAVHGGGYVGGSRFTHRKLFAHLAKAIGARALLVEYRLMHQGGAFPGAIEDVLTAYRWLLGQGGDPARTAFVGDSAGGGLVMMSQLLARERGVALPAASMLISPWIDLAVTGETMTTNHGRDALFNKPWVEQMAGDFLAGTDPRNPAVNPLHADLTGFGPIFIQVGDQELLLDDSRALAAYAEKAGVDVRLDVFPEQQHTFQMAAGRAPEADDAIRRFAQWARPLLLEP